MSNMQHLVTTGLPGITSAGYCEITPRDLGKSTDTLYLKGDNQLQLTLDNGAVLVIVVTEWGYIDYYPPPTANTETAEKLVINNN